MNRVAALRQLEREVADRQAVFSLGVNVALKLRAALGDPDLHVDAALHLVQAEPVLAARVVAMANSVAYNRYGRDVADLRSAVARLGFQALRTLAMGLVVGQMARTSSGPGRDLAARLWEYTASVAALGRVVAREMTGQDPEIAVFAGLVHDLGGFYLLTRGESFPDLLSGNFDAAETGAEQALTRAMLSNLNVPGAVVEGIEAFWGAEPGPCRHPLGETLRLAASLAPPHPLRRAVVSTPAIGQTEALVAEANDEVSRLREIVDEAQEELSALMNLMQY